MFHRPCEANDRRIIGALRGEVDISTTIGCGMLRGDGRSRGVPNQPRRLEYDYLTSHAKGSSSRTKPTSAGVRQESSPPARSHTCAGRFRGAYSSTGSATSRSDLATLLILRCCSRFWWQPWCWRPAAWMTSLDPSHTAGPGPPAARRSRIRPCR
jgi:hypothetical protein